MDFQWLSIFRTLKIYHLGLAKNVQNKLIAESTLIIVPILQTVYCSRISNPIKQQSQDKWSVNKILWSHSLLPFTYVERNITSMFTQCTQE